MLQVLAGILYQVYRIVPEVWVKARLICKRANGTIVFTMQTERIEDDQCICQQWNKQKISDGSNYTKEEVNTTVNSIIKKCKFIFEQDPDIQMLDISASIMGDVKVCITKNGQQFTESYEDVNFIDLQAFTEESKPLKWFFVKPLKKFEFIDQFEDHYLCKFEKDFRELFFKFNGGSPSKAVFKIPFVGKFKIANLLSFNDKVYYDSEELVSDALKFIRNEAKNYKLLPFAAMGSNNYVCLNSKYEIIFFNSSKKKEYKVADNLEKFLKKLQQ